MIEGGYVVTNYHVVWPYEQVWVVFPDGTELQNVPVVGWDPLSDLAVLGPVEVLARPLKLEDGESMPLGSELLLVGYPAEVDQFPEPSITRGILSRYREWGRLGMTYLQTDATIVGGQSGGALVNSNGSVVGISGFRFREGGFALAASSADVVPVVEKLAQGEFTSDLGDRRLPTGQGKLNFDVDLRTLWDTRIFALSATAGTVLQVEVDGLGDVWFHVSDPYGPLLEVNDNYTGVEFGEVELQLDGIHFLQVEMSSGDSGNFDLTSNVRLKPINDQDDGRDIAVGDTIAGSLDHFTDWDWYSVHLDEGETVRIHTDSLLVDTIVYVDFANSRSNQVVSDDDGGGGLFGRNAELVYRAPVTGEYYIAVTEAAGETYAGGYYLSVEPAREGTETVHVPPSPEVIDGPHGSMVLYKDPSQRFQIGIPQAWTELVIDESLGELFAAHDPAGNSSLLIVEENVADLGMGSLTLTEYADVIKSVVIDPLGARVIAREEVQTSQQLPAVRFEVSLVNERVVRLIYLADDGSAFNVTYSYPPERQDSLEPLVDFSFSTFTDLLAPAAATFGTPPSGVDSTLVQSQEYTNDRYGHSIEIAPGWALDEDTDEYVAFWSSDGNAWLEITVWDIETSDSLSELAEQVWDTSIATADDEGWNLLELTSWESKNVNGREFYQLAYRKHFSEEYCIEHIFTVIELPASTPSNPYGLITSAGICEHSLDIHEQDVQDMIESFRP